jgi:hypothetical protein
MGKLICFTVLILVVCNPAAAMDFSLADTDGHGNLAPVDPSGQGSMILMRGEIVPGDYARLIDFAVSNHLVLANSGFILASPGGDVTEALRIGQLIKGLYASVAVFPSIGRCASACFIIYVSAVRRLSVDRGIGIHRPYLSPDRLRGLSLSEVESLENRAWLDAESYLHQLRVPPTLVEEMFGNASTEIHWLSGREIYQLGEFAPWFEEFLIARCGLKKDAEMRSLLGARISADEEASLAATSACEIQLTRPEALRNMACAVRQEVSHAPCK